MAIGVYAYRLLSIHTRRRLYPENTRQIRSFSYPPLHYYENFCQKRSFSSPSSHYSENMGQKGPFCSRFALPEVDLRRRRELFNGFDIVGGRNFTTMPIDVTFDQAWLKRQMRILPGVHSVLFTRLEEGKHIVVNVPGLEKTESDEGLCISLNIPGVEKKDVSARIDEKYLLIQGKTHEEMYLAGMTLPYNFNKNNYLKGKMKDGMLKLTLPNVENQELLIAKSVAYCSGTGIYEYFGHQACVIYSSILFDPLYLGQRYCPAIARQKAGCRSFTMYKKETSERLYLKASAPGLEKVELTSDGLCISLNMPGLEMEDVELFFKYDTFFIEGRREKEHYIAGVRIPHGFHKENDMIKREMHDGMYKATFPRVTEEDEEMEKRKANKEFYIS